MKSISITTIICGTALIIAPLIHNIILLQMVASLMQRGFPHVDLSGALSNSYSGWCMFVGICVIASGLTVGVRSARRSRAVAPGLSGVQAVASGV